MQLFRVPRKAFFFSLFVILIVTNVATADEGMWLFTNPPKEQIQKKYHFILTQPFLDHMRLSSLRTPNGSSEFVSPDGLVMTNHHVAQGCIHDLSTNGKDYMKNGFYAAAREQEPKCPGIEFIVLTDIKDVTEQMHAAAKPGMTAAESGKATRQAMAAAEKECSGPGVKCDVVTLYAGGMHHLYRYKKYTDVRLVFAPEFQMAFFGGDPDNFTYPRYDLDITFFRVYEDGKPAHTENYLKFAKEGAKEGDLIFVSGHPGKTNRLLTVHELEFLRDVQFPWQLKNLDRRVNLLLDFSKQGAEQAREAEHDLFGLQNSLKAYKGYNTFFASKEGMEKKREDEKQLRDYLAKSADRQKEFGDPFAQIDQAEDTLRTMFFDYQYVEMLAGLRGSLMTDARFIVRATEQKKVPNDQRLRGYTDSALATKEQELFSNAPEYKDLNEAMLANSLADFQEQQPDNPVLKKVLAGKSPKDRAAELIQGTKLNDPAFRKQLYEGGDAAVQASTDPLIVMMREIEPSAVEIRKKYDDEVDSKLRDGGSKVARIRFAIFGQTQPPDATFTLRLSYGPLKGYEEGGKHIAWSTTMDGAYQHAQENGNKPPFELPKSWMDARGKFNGKTPFDAVSTADIIGGNSGSPVVNTKGELVGIIFDGNIQSLPLNFAYDDVQARAVHVDSRAILESLQKIYHADGLYKELQSASK